MRNLFGFKQNLAYERAKQRGTQAMHNILTVDVGGTNTRVARADGAKLDLSSIQRFRNDDIPHPTAAIATFLSAHGETKFDAICMDVAGPVDDAKGQLTNRDWVITHSELSQMIGGKPAFIINDMQAQGHGLAQVPADLCKHVHGPTDVVEGAPKLVVNVGTGYNAAPVLFERGASVVPATEAGHVTLPVYDADDLALFQHLSQEHGFAAEEDVLSGRGLVAVYRYYGGDVSLSGHDIMSALNTGNDPIARQAVATFVRTLGRSCGDLCLTHLPRGGVYFVGSVALAAATYFDAFDFKSALCSKGRFSEFLSDFSFFAVEDGDAALRGCAAYAQNALRA